MQKCNNHDCVEDRAEITRHHRDFEAIREVLERYELDDNWIVQQICKDLRNIVG